MYFRTKREYEFYKLLNPDFNDEFQETKGSSSSDNPLNINFHLKEMNGLLESGRPHSVLFDKVQKILRLTFEPKDFAKIYSFVAKCFELENDYDVAILYYAFSLQFYRDEENIKAIKRIYHDYYKREYNANERSKIVELSYGFMKRQSNLKFLLNENIVKIWQDDLTVLELFENISEKIN